MHQEFFTVGSKLAAQVRLGRTPIMLGADKVGDDLDVVKIESLDRCLFKKARNGSNPVRLLQGISGDGQVTSVCTNERDVSSVQGCDDGNVSFFLDRFARQYRT